MPDVNTPSPKFVTHPIGRGGGSEAFFHVVGWVVFGYLISLFDFYDYDEISGDTFMVTHPFFAIPRTGAAIFFFYVHSFWLFPRYFTSSRIIYFALLIALLAVTLALLMTADEVFIRYANESGMRSVAVMPYTAYRAEIPGFNISGILLLLVPVPSLIYSFARQWTIDQQIKEEITREKIIAENQMLRAQINPHFLFNTLNTFFSLAQKQGAKEIEEGVATLSEMFRHTLEQDQTSKALLTRELRYISSYIHLQKMRFMDGNDVDIRFEVEGDPKPYRVHPMILIVFIENAFKHGVRADGPSFVHILISVSDVLDLRVSNSYSPRAQDSSLGLGLRNVEHRLQLLYPNKHVLQQEHGEDNHQIHLQIDLS